jgi:hypothetical protein
MNHIKDFKSWEVNEGWKENILAGLLSLVGSHLIGQDTQKITTKTKSEANVETLIKGGWSLDSTSIDTLYTRTLKANPDTQVVATRLTLSGGQFFPSGEWKLDPKMKSEIDSILGEILQSDGIILKVEIESSTDKQPLSRNLSTQLKSLGFTPDNKGLSMARNSSVGEYLTQLGVNDSLINKTELFEKGSGVVEEGARYVNIDFYYMQIYELTRPGTPEMGNVPRKTFYLSKEMKPTDKVGKIVRKNAKTKILGPVKNNPNRSQIKCMVWD